MDQRITAPESHHDLQRRSFNTTLAAILSAPLVLAIATFGILCLWLLLTLSVVFALIACSALVAIGLPICALLAKHSWRRRFPPTYTDLHRRLGS